MWSILEPERIENDVLKLIVDPENQIWFSAISIWEIVTKIQVGKLGLEKGFEDAIAEQGFQYLPFETAHALRVFDLPLLHRDPFDRALLGQAAQERFRFLTADKTLGLYQGEVDLLMMR